MLDLTHRHRDVRRLVLAHYGSTLRRHGWDPEDFIQSLYVRLLANPVPPIPFSMYVISAARSILSARIRRARSDKRWGCELVPTADEDLVNAAGLGARADDVTLAHEIWDALIDEQRVVMADWIEGVYRDETAEALGWKPFDVSKSRTQIRDQFR